MTRTTGCRHICVHRHMLLLFGTGRRWTTKALERGEGTFPQPEMSDVLNSLKDKESE